MTYFVLSPFEVFSEEELKKKTKEDISDRKCLAVVFDCQDYKDFERKYFGKD